jgi:Acetyltransferase (GNAT) domain
MKILGKKEIGVVNLILTNAFVNNKSVNYALKKKHDKDLISMLMAYSIKKGEMYGDIWLNAESNACCILIDPSRSKKTTLNSLWWDVKLIFNVIGISNLKKIIDKENITNKFLPKDLDYIHLWFIGVDNDVQGKGFGCDFMSKIITYYTEKKSAICLETSTLKNLPFYKKLGFEVYHKVNFGFDFYFLIKYL